MITRNRNGATAVPLRAGAGLLLCALLASLALPAAADSLYSRLRRLSDRQSAVRERLHEVKQTQRSATVRLQTAQQRLAALEDRLDTARAQLRATRRELAAVRAELKRVRAQMDTHQQAVRSHLLALYKSDQTSYLTVVLQAQSFDDFANRERFAQSMFNQDQYHLRRLEVLEANYDRQRQALAAQERKRTALEAQIREDEAQAASDRNEVKDILGRANRQRAADEEMLAQLAREESAMQALARSSGRARYWGTCAGNLLTPVSGARFTSPFGMRTNPVTGRYCMHNGIDLACPTGTPIHAADKGLVIAAGWRGSVSGNTVIIDHGSGLTTAYCHASRVLVSAGSVVSRGQTVALVGNTGRSTGPHLHFGVMKDGDWVNPLNFTR